MGQGSGRSLFAMIQKMGGNDPVAHGIFSWLHNEWIQLLFEQGIVGLFSFLLCYFCALYKSLSSTYLFPVVFVCGFYAAGNWPVHFSTHALMFMFIAAVVFRREHGRYSDNQDRLQT